MEMKRCEEGGLMGGLWRNEYTKNEDGGEGGLKMGKCHRGIPYKMMIISSLERRNYTQTCTMVLNYGKAKRKRGFKKRTNSM